MEFTSNDLRTLNRFLEKEVKDWVEERINFAKENDRVTVRQRVPTTGFIGIAAKVFARCPSTVVVEVSRKLFPIKTIQVYVPKSTGDEKIPDGTVCVQRKKFEYEFNGSTFYWQGGDLRNTEDTLCVKRIKECEVEKCLKMLDYLGIECGNFTYNKICKNFMHRQLESI